VVDAAATVLDAQQHSIHETAVAHARDDIAAPWLRQR
jgi:hypothetical protein